jgi:PAS domain S-box-containing protein
MAIMLLITGAVLLVTCTAFFAFEYFSFRQSAPQTLSTLGQVIAANTTASVAFDNAADAGEMLAALQAEPHIRAAVLYDREGKVFAKYPANLPASAYPAVPQPDGNYFGFEHFSSVQPVIQSGRRLGTLYLDSDMTAMYEKFRLYLLIAFLASVAAILLAYPLARLLQRQISVPILALAETARAVSEHRDYSVRAKKLGKDEVGLLTDAFNHMLGEIHGQNQALRESENRLRSVINSALSAVVVIDARGVITDWNARAEKMFGRQRTEALGRDLAETIIPPRHREAHRQGMARLAATGDGPVLNRLVELSALRKDGGEFPVEFSISPVRTGEVVTFCGFITDITERKQAELRVQAQLGRLNLLHQITRGMGERLDLKSIFHVILRNLEDNLAIDLGCVCLYDAECNQLTVTSLRARPGALSGEPAIKEETPVPIDQNGLSRCVRGELVYEADTSQMPFPFPQQLAGCGLLSFVAAPLLVEGNVFGVLVAARCPREGFSSADCEFLRQLTEHAALAAHQARLYGALQQAYDDLRQTQQTVLQQERLRALGQMASGIAHDINNALSPVALYTESLIERETGLSERGREYLRTIQLAVEDVAETVARMREFYRQREPQLLLAPIELNQLVQQVLDLTRARWRDLPQSQGIDIRLETQLAARLPGLMGAEVEIRDALTNLVFNAVDAMPKGGTLTVRTRPVAEPGQPEVPGAVQLEVSDTGVGMDEETRRRCLEPFFTTKGERGTGLGLAMVYGMVQRHSADIELVSEPGRGTTVRIIFPVSTPVVESAVHLPAVRLPVRRLRLLIVDDDPLLIKSLRDILEGDGHVVTTAEGGQAGIDALAAAKQRGEMFGLVVTDLGMPYVDGRRVAAAVKAAAPGTPVILLTGWGRRLMAENDIPPGVDRVLNKPPRLQELRQALAELTNDQPSSI